MKAVDEELGALLRLERRYLIPTYQRDYEWTEEGQWQLLMDDVLGVTVRLLEARQWAEMNGADQQKAEGDVGPHFLGAIVLEALPHRGAHVDASTVIDGQQRLTTVYLLLRGILDVLEDQGLERRARQLHKMLLIAAEDVIEPDETYKLWPRRRDRDAWKAVLDTEPPNGDHLYSLARRYFGDRVRAEMEDLHVDAKTAFLEGLVDALTQKIKIVVVDLESADDAQLIFEVLNGRQTPLSAADLVKNLLFMRADLSEAELDALYDRYWSPFDDSWWSERIGTGHAARGRRDQLLATWLTVETADEVSLGHLYPEARSYLARTTAKLPEILGGIHVLAREYRQIYERTSEVPTEIAEVYKRMERLGVTTAVPLLAWLRTQPAERLTPGRHQVAVQAIDSFVMRRLITGGQTRGYGRAFLEVLRSVKEAPPDVPIDQAVIQALLDEPYSLTWPTDSEMINEFRQRSFYGRIRQERIRMLLGPIDAYNQRLRDKSEQATFDYDTLTIEHIMPRQWRTNWPVVADNLADLLNAEQQRDWHLHRMGNLTLVTGSLNPALSNADWPTKRAELHRHSKLTLNDDLNRFDVWDEEHITHRGEQLAKAACHVWTRPRIPTEP